MHFELFNSPVVMACGCRNAITAERRCTRPRKMFFRKKLVVAKTFNHFHDGTVACLKHVFSVCQRGLLMHSPKFFVHFSVGFPGVGFWQKWLFVAVCVCCDPRKQQLMPLIQMHQNVAQIFVTLPMRFFFGRYDFGKIKLGVLL